MTFTDAERAILAKLKDPRYFIERFFWIVDKMSKKVPFLFNLPQSTYYANRTNNDLILKARKHGISSLLEAEFLHSCMMEPNQKAVTMSHTLGDTKIHLDRIDFFLKNMGTKHYPFEVTLETENSKELTFPETGSSYWIGTAGSRSFGRGRDITKLHLSEVPHYENQAVLTSVLEACTPNARKVMEGTANGIGERFCQLWGEAEDPQSASPWKCHFFPWFADPANVYSLPQGVNVKWTDQELKMQHAHGLSLQQVYWYRLKKAGMADKDLMPQEYPSTPQEAFISSGRPLLNQDRLTEMVSRSSQPQWKGELYDDGHTIHFNPSEGGRLSIWKMPREWDKFLISADVAEGVAGGAYSVAKVFHRSSWECVAQFRGRLDPGTYGRVLVDLAQFFNNAVLCPEMNNHGWATLEAIRAEHYPHVLKTTDIWPDDATAKWGFPTNEKTRNLAFSALNNAVETRNYVEHDLVTLRELQALVRDQKGKVVVQSGYADCAITAAIGLYCLKFFTLDETYREDQRARGGIAVTSLVSRPKGRTGYR